MRKHKYKRRFQDWVMQEQYERLVRSGMHWRKAEKKILKIHGEYSPYYV